MNNSQKLQGEVSLKEPKEYKIYEKYFEDKKYEEVYWVFSRIFERIKRVRYDTKYLSQKVFRKNHISDTETWNAYCYLAKKILPRLEAFRNARKSGTPCAEILRSDPGAEDEFSMDKWNALIDEMIFGFKFVCGENGNKKCEAEIKALVGDWDAKTPENAHYHFMVPHTDKDLFTLLSEVEELSEDQIEYLKKKHGENWKENNIYYHNRELSQQVSERADRGIKLFGEYFYSLWD